MQRRGEIPFDWVAQVLLARFPGKGTDRPVLNSPKNISFAELVASVMWGAGESNIDPQAAVLLFDTLQEVVPEEEGVLDLSPQQLVAVTERFGRVMGTSSARRKWEDVQNIMASAVIDAVLST